MVNSNNKIYFIENKTLDVLAVYSDIPYTGQSLNCVPRVWLKQDIEKNLKNYIDINIRSIKVKNNLGTNAGTYFMLETSKAYNDIDTNFYFSKEWPFELKINGDEEVLEEDPIIAGNNPATKLLFGIFCFNSYQFVYDIKFPVLVQLTKNGYTLQFAVQSIIQKNQPRINRAVFENIESDENRFCTASKTSNVIYALNFENGASLEDASVKVKCISSICDVGKTKLQGQESYLDALTPSCLNAEIIASKEGFNDAVTIANTNEQGSINLELKPKHNLKAELKVIENGQVRSLYDNENVLVQFIDSDDNYAVTIDKNIESTELIAGSYDASSFLIVSGLNITLSGTDVEKCVDIPKSGVLGLVGLKDRKCFSTKIDSLNVDQVISGGDKFGLELFKDDLSTASKIVIYVTKNPTPESIEELKNEINLIETNSNNPEFKLPQLT